MNHHFAISASSDLFLLVFYVLLALGVSFLCSIAEAVLLSITPSYIEGIKAKQPKLAALVQRLKHRNVDQSLAAILTLNTVAHTVGALGAGAKATLVFGSAWFGLFSAAMTLMILFLSEIIPKTIGARYWSKLVGPTAFFVKTLIVFSYPVVKISEKLTQWIAGGKTLYVFSREEFIAMAKMGEKTGHIQDSESRIIRNLFRFGSLSVSDIMTPRPVMSVLCENDTIGDAFEFVAQAPFSRFPLYRKNIDDITGFVLRDDVLMSNAMGQTDQKLSTLKRDILLLPDSAPLYTLLEYFFKNRKHIAVVVNEYGGTKGLVTLEDLVETLMGMEIMDETDDVEDMRALARKQWAERAKILGVKQP